MARNGTCEGGYEEGTDTMRYTVYAMFYDGSIELDTITAVSYENALIQAATISRSYDKPPRKVIVSECLPE